MENYSKYHSSDLPEQEDDGAAQGSDKNKTEIFKIEKQKGAENDPPQAVKMEED
jgi:hypothetical protein